MIIDQVEAVRGALAGQVAVVTGAGRGIGREAARALARLGASVVIGEIDQQTGQETAKLIRAEGGEARFIQVDVADEASVTGLYQAVGQADILINNACTFTFGPLWEQSTADWDRVMAVNLRGAFLCIRAFLPGMLQRRRGVVVTMESSEGMAYLAPYLASKVGLRSLALSLAHEVGEESGVSVYCFGPGMVDTPAIAEALQRLPALYGMSREEFISQSGVSMLAPEVCAAGLVGTVLHAAEFHGQQAGYASGLARLGLNIAGELFTEELPAEEIPQDAGPRDSASSAITLNRELEAILEANIREYGELTMFQRPIVRLMFQQGTGMKVEEWLAQARQMTHHLERGGAPGKAAYLASLKRLAQFIKKQELDARGYFKEPAALERALKALGERHAVVSRLAERLEELE